jgi:hypothetical protein
MKKDPHENEPKGAEHPDPTTRKPQDEEEESLDKTEEEESLDKTIEDSFPASDPPSSIPDPHEDEGAA